MGEGTRKSSDGASLGEEKACLDCIITKNQPQMGLQRVIEFSAMFIGSTRLSR